jgi:hypothetical protein
VEEVARDRRGTLDRTRQELPVCPRMCPNPARWRCPRESVRRAQPYVAIFRVGGFHPSASPWCSSRRFIVEALWHVVDDARSAGWPRRSEGGDAPRPTAWTCADACETGGLPREVAYTTRHSGLRPVGSRAIVRHGSDNEPVRGADRPSSSRGTRLRLIHSATSTSGERATARLSSYREASGRSKTGLWCAMRLRGWTRAPSRRSRSREHACATVGGSGRRGASPGPRRRHVAPRQQVPPEAEAHGGHRPSGFGWPVAVWEPGTGVSDVPTAVLVEHTCRIVIPVALARVTGGPHTVPTSPGLPEHARCQGLCRGRRVQLAVAGGFSGRGPRGRQPPCRAPGGRVLAGTGGEPPSSRGARAGDVPRAVAAGGSPPRQAATLPSPILSGAGRRLRRPR